MTGKELRKARKARRLSQEDLARLVGVSPATISRWERMADIHYPEAAEARVHEALEGAPIKRRKARKKVRRKSSARRSGVDWDAVDWEGKSISQVARELGVSRQRAHQVAAARGISTERPQTKLSELRRRESGLCSRCERPAVLNALCEEHLAKRRRRYEQARDDGRCTRCGGPSDGRYACPSCREICNARRRAARAASGARQTSRSPSSPDATLENDDG